MNARRRDGIDPTVFRVLVEAIDDVDDFARPSTVTLTPSQSAWLLSEANRLRTLPLVIHALERGCLVMDGDSTAEAMARVPGLLTSMLAIEHSCLQALSILRDAGINARVIKGISSAHLDYPKPSLRQSADVDLLVAPHDMEGAISAFAAGGARRKHPIRGGRWETQHAVTFDVSGVEVDLHHRLLHRCAGHLAARLPLFDEPVDFVVGDQSIEALAPPLRLIVAAGQNVLSAPTGRKAPSDVDVLRLARVADEAYAVAAGAELGWLLDLAFTRAFATIGERWSDRSGGGWRSKLLRSGYRSGNPSAVRAAGLEALCAPPRTTLLTLSGVIRPGQEYLSRRGRSQRQQIQRQLGRLSTRSR